MGWNTSGSYNLAGENEDMVKRGVDAIVTTGLKAAGYRYVLIDYGWYQEEVGVTKTSRNPTNRCDAYGRLVPYLERFPSAANGRGFRSLADDIHGQGMKFGLHIMRGIYRGAYDANLPIKGTTFRARDITDNRNKKRERNTPMTNINRFLKQTLLCVALSAAAVPLFGQGTTAAATNAIPAGVGKVTPEDWAAYRKWEALLPADQQAWEKQLQKYLGSYCFPLYLKGRLAGKYTLEEPRDWGFVPDDPKLPRVLLIGDSISHMYTESVRRLLKGKANVHRAPANCGTTNMGLKAMDDWLDEASGKKWDLIHFNFGIHDRRKSPEAYAANLKKLVARLQKTGAILVWARTTPFANDPKAKEQYTMLNGTADAVMTKHGILIDDVYSTVAGNLDKFLSGDKVHFNQYGVKVQAEQVAKVIAEAIQTKK
jgi:lysophospholipase L1-like esterase